MPASLPSTRSGKGVHAPGDLQALGPSMVTKYGVNAMALKRAWESSQRVTKEDWCVPLCVQIHTIALVISFLKSKKERKSNSGCPLLSFGSHHPFEAHSPGRVDEALQRGAAEGVPFTRIEGMPLPCAGRAHNEQTVMCNGMTGCVADVAACASLAHLCKSRVYLNMAQARCVHPSMARELFAAGFVSCWSELDENLQHQLVRRAP
eukprot:1162062-Pelagomonas_calceolata.AAC.23